MYSIPNNKLIFLTIIIENWIIIINMKNIKDKNIKS